MVVRLWVAVSATSALMWSAADSGAFAQEDAGNTGAQGGLHVEDAAAVGEEGLGWTHCLYRLTERNQAGHGLKECGSDDHQHRPQPRHLIDKLGHRYILSQVQRVQAAAAHEQVDQLQAELVPIPGTHPRTISPPPTGLGAALMIVSSFRRR